MEMDTAQSNRRASPGPSAWGAEQHSAQGGWRWTRAGGSQLDAQKQLYAMVLVSGDMSLAEEDLGFGGNLLIIGARTKAYSEKLSGSFSEKHLSLSNRKTLKLGAYKRNIIESSVSKLGKSDHHANPVSSLLLCVRLFRAWLRSGILQSPSATDKPSSKQKS